jgi:nicotinamide mononucleotide transporter
MQAFDAALSLTAHWVAPWFTLWGAPVSALEAVAFVLGLWMVWGNFHVKVWAWPLAFISSAMYGLLFVHAKLYGEAGLQVLFMVMAAWGAWQWLHGTLGRHELPDAGHTAEPLRVRVMPPRGRWISLAVAAALWPVLGLLLDHLTDSDVPYWDALPTAGSVVGQYLLGRQWVENWPCWLLVNLVSMGLFAYKGLWLTVVLYGLFAALSIWGWRQWVGLSQARQL